ETEYIIKLFPIGGYCLMEGEDTISNNPKSFNNKSIFQRASIIFAGPIFNIIFSIIVLIPVFMMLGTPTTVIKSIETNSPAQVAGLNVGDKILFINGD
ncbi:MAG TPA: RIP metalloprotease RseP, partial [Firmicutes bacterium]|nr:RIP metalloprotease RseP [Bacillota bacterium]